MTETKEVIHDLAGRAIRQRFNGWNKPMTMYKSGAMKKVTVSLPAEIIEHYKGIGYGNLSVGIRIKAEKDIPTKKTTQAKTKAKPVKVKKVKGRKVYTFRKPRKRV